MEPNEAMMQELEKKIENLNGEIEQLKRSSRKILADSAEVTKKMEHLEDVSSQLFMLVAQTYPIVESLVAQVNAEDEEQQKAFHERLIENKRAMLTLIQSESTAS